MNKGPEFETLERKLLLAGNLVDGPAIDFIYDTTDGTVVLRPEEPSDIFGIELFLKDSPFAALPVDPAPFQQFLSRTPNDIVWSSVESVAIDVELSLGALLPSGISSAAELSNFFEQVRYGDASGTHDFDLIVLEPKPPEIAISVAGAEPTGDITFGLANLGDPTPFVEVELANHGDLPLSVSPVIAGPFTIAGQTPRILIIERGASHTLTVFMDTSSAGPQEGRIVITHNDPSTQTPLELDLVGAVSEVLYVSFDGYNIGGKELRKWATPSATSAEIPATSDWATSVSFIDRDGDGIEVAPFLEDHPNRDDIIDKIMRHIAIDLRPFGVRPRRLMVNEFVVEGQRATTVFVGRSSVDDGPHIAGDIDFGNDNLTDIAFVGEEDWLSDRGTALVTSQLVLHEAGHTFGLEHVRHSVVETPDDQLNRTSIMSFGDANARRELLDADFLEADIDLLADPTQTQNSFEYLLSIFGTGNTGPAKPQIPEDLLPPKSDWVPSFYSRGDIDGDGIVGFSDFLILAGNFSKKVTPGTDGDLTEDGIVNFADFLRISENFSQRFFFPLGG